TSEPEVTAEPEPTEASQEEKERPSVVYYFGDKEEEGGVLPFAMMDLNYYGPIGGYVEKGGYDRFKRASAPNMGLYIGFDRNERESSMEPKDYFEQLKSIFGDHISREIGIGGVKEWEWYDQQVLEEVTMNGLTCLKFSGVIGGKNSNFPDSDTIWKRYVTGYATEAEVIYDGKAPFYQLVFVVSSYDTGKAEVYEITDEIKEQLQHNVDTLMSTAYWELPQDRKQ
ncbi:MAG: hypothetical protein PUC65_04370, partial [Clostridiales bacterium]|nr:hypothetical protein [Clostridiales bacterium]